jgi:hypothetical protein
MEATHKPLQNDLPRRKLVTWLILVYDRGAEQRFPFKRKWYRFNHERATPEQVDDVLKLCGHKPADPFPNAPPLRLDETRVSFQIGGLTSTSPQILNYRHLFDYVPDESDLHTGIDEYSGLLSVTLPHESYFEDESEKPITLLEVFDEEAKRRSGKSGFAIVMGNPESVLRCGPAEPERPELWTEADADLMTHLFETYRQLVQSRWIQSPCIVSPVSESEIHSLLPAHEDCMAVVLPFRQLYSKDGMDDLFNRCCKIHGRHCPKGHPTHYWINHYRRQFNAELDGPVGFPLQGCELPAKRYLDAFAYGARMVHSTGKKAESEVDLIQLLESHPREMVVMGYHATLNHLLQTVSMAAPVLAKNFHHWTQELGWTASKSPAGRRLFE